MRNDPLRATRIEIACGGVVDTGGVRHSPARVDFARNWSRSNSNQRCVEWHGLFLAPRAWRGPTRYVFIPRCRGLCERILKRRYKRRQIVAYDVPQDVEVNGIVTVNQPIAQTHDFGPRNVGMAEAFFGGYAACRFADDLKQPDKGKVQLAVTVEVAASSPGGHCHCLLGVIQHVAQAYVAFMARHTEPRPPPRRGCESRG